MEFLKADSAHDPLHLAVGITGHRDVCLNQEVAHDEKLREAIYIALTKLRGSPAVPATVLSSLARGADRVAADVALKMGCSLVAVLPMPEAEYERDFRGLGETEDDIAEFRKLLGLASDSFVVPARSPEHETVYGGASQYIASRAHLLLAMWDGGKETRGGTAWVVNRFLGRPGAEMPPPGWPRGPVYQIRVHRESACSGSMSALSVEWLCPEGENDGTIEEFLKRLRKGSNL